MAALEEVVLSSDELEVVLLPEVGARLHRLRAFGVDLLRTPTDPATHREDPFFWGAYVLAPWANRASARPMAIAGRRVQLRPNFPDGTAIHGLVYDRVWERVGPASFVFASASDDAWPWSYRVTADVAVDGSRLELRYALENSSDTPMPAGLGLHPWFVQPVEVALDARAVHPRNDDPAAAALPAEGRWALDDGRQLRRGLDATWLDVDPPSVRLRWPSTGMSLAAEARVEGGSPLHVAVASPDEPAAVAVEPVTHEPWGLDRLVAGASGAMRVLDPGEAVELRIGLAVGRALGPR